MTRKHVTSSSEERDASWRDPTWPESQETSQETSVVNESPTWAETIDERAQLGQKSVVCFGLNKKVVGQWAGGPADNNNPFFTVFPQYPQAHKVSSS
jgi:hypothetical protein